MLCFVHCEQGEIGMKHNYRGWFAKPISVLLTAFLLCGTTGCNGNINSGSITNSPSEVFIPVPVPEDGWTLETIARTVCIDGKTIEYPFTIDRLNQEFTINKNDTQIFESGAASTILYKDGIPILTIEFQNITSYNQIKSTEPSGFSSYYKDSYSIDENIRQILSINGIQLGASKNDIESAFGFPDITSNNVLSYKDKYTDKFCVGFWLNDKDELYSFTVVID